MAGSECASLSGSAVVTVSHSTHSDSESVANASASEHESCNASSSLKILHVFCVYRHVIHVGNMTWLLNNTEIGNKNTEIGVHAY
jgi:hypothetical protein